MARLLPMLLAALAIAGSAAAATQYPDVKDESVEAPASRVMKLSIVIKAPRDVLWKAMTDASEMPKWNVPVAFADIRPGGMIEASYNPAARQGDPQNIKNEIVAVDPGRMLVFHNVQAPEGLPGRERFGKVISYALFEDAEPGLTRVTIGQVGYGGGDEDRTLFNFFRAGNAYLLANMKHVYGGGPKPDQPVGH